MSSFNVRVYGLLIHDDKLLVSDEHIKGMDITKLPGGGLEFGEGTIDCLIREFKEELNLDIEVVSHFYTTDFFVASAFSKQHQVISIYYRVKAKRGLDFKVSEIPFDFSEKKDGAQSMRWISLNELSELDFTLVIDKQIAQMLKRGIV